MSKNRDKIGISIDKKIDDELEKNNYNKSKLINSLLDKWLKSDNKNLNEFQKKV